MEEVKYLYINYNLKKKLVEKVDLSDFNTHLLFGSLFTFLIFNTLFILVRKI